jgi:uncharacterized protein YkwD
LVGVHLGQPARRHALRISLPILVGVLLSSCSITPSTGRGGGSSTNGLLGGPALNAAQADFFANRYGKADGSYRQYIANHPSDSTGHAEYALFLNYNHRYAEALTQARTAAALAPSSAIAAAVQTRIRDWSAHGAVDFKAAVAIGARAVKLGPESALAHAFYSEALADSGDTTRAQLEIDTAGQLAATTYEKSEIERERSNLAFIQSDRPGQLAHLLAAQKLQPGWAERTREVAEFYFGAGDLDKAKAQFQQAIAMAPEEAALRESLGSVALTQQDIPVAQEAFVAANQLTPHDPRIESTLAITSFATKRDTAETEKLLRAAAAESPRSADLASLLEGFLRYIKRDPAAADRVVVGTPPPEPIRPQATFPVDVRSLRDATSQEGLAAINAARAKANLAPVKLDPRITEGATSHAYWWLFNLALPQSIGLGIHKEVSGSPGYTGYSMRDRATSFGFPLGSMAEDITHRGEPAGAVADWIDSVFHRFPIMRADLDAIGFGAATGGGLPIEVMDMSYRDEPGDPHQQVAFPADGQTGVPATFRDNELPDPVPPGGRLPTGYPITVNYNPFVGVFLVSSKITDASGQQVDAYTLPPVPSEHNVLTLLPKQPLKLSTRYTVSVSVTIDGDPRQLQWSFTTESVPALPAPTPQA